jgi:hypothetical protein
MSLSAGVVSVHPYIIHTRYLLLSHAPLTQQMERRYAALNRPGARRNPLIELHRTE